MNDTPSPVVCRPARREDMSACAAIVNRWIDDTHWMPRIHYHGDVQRYYRTVFAERDVNIAEYEGKMAAFMALSEDHYVTALYVERRMRGKGCGKALLDLAKEKHPDGLKLWTFQANQGARRFYLREGFREVRRTNGDNEEGLPDILLEWTPCP
jgi:GNAT superfamily N-acetyltransferase